MVDRVRYLILFVACQTGDQTNIVLTIRYEPPIPSSDP